MLEVEIPAVWYPYGDCRAQLPSIKSASFLSLVSFPTTLSRVMSYTSGALGRLPWSFPLSFLFGLSCRPELLEEHPFIDFPGPKQLVISDGLHRHLQG